MTERKRVTMSFVAVTAAFSVVLAVMGWQIRSNRQLARQGAQAHDSLCVLRGDRKRQVASAEKRLRGAQEFLKEHPNGIPGIPAALLRSSVAGQRADVAAARQTVRALARLDCP